jgi:hypothetical protein
VLMVTGAVPVEVNVTGSVDAEFTVTLPNAKLGSLMVNVGTFAAVAFSCKAKVLETPLALAVSVTDCAVVTEDTVAVNPALVAFAGTNTAAGTATAALLLVRPTLTPPLPAAGLSVTVQASLPDPVIDALLQESALNAADTPVPVSVVPEFVVSVVLPPAALPQPGSETTTRQHVNIVNSFAHEPSSLGIGPRLHWQHELNNVLTSVNAPIPRLINEYSQALAKISSLQLPQYEGRLAPVNTIVFSLGSHPCTSHAIVFPSCKFRPKPPGNATVQSNASRDCHSIFGGSQ